MPATPRTPRRASGRSILAGVGLSLFAGCFGGEFLDGRPCISDDDCGPRLECRPDRTCGGEDDLCGNGVVDADEECDDGDLAVVELMESQMVSSMQCADSDWIELSHDRLIDPIPTVRFALSQWIPTGRRFMHSGVSACAG